MTAPILMLEGITKTFAGVTAVARLDLAVERGAFVTLLGPSGCGKSTTLRLIGGFERPDAGRIMLAGKDVTRLPPNHRDVNMVFQDYALFPHMSVAQNIAFGLELKGLDRTRIATRIDELIAFLELGHLVERMPDQLSGGQRQRVALARALAPDPEVLLLDEPLGALDAKLRAQVQVELKAIQVRTGKTFVFVTHDQDEALTMSDRVIVMNHGLVEQDGTPEELYQHPISRFVADFIGDTNLFTCRVVAVDRGIARLDWGGHALVADLHGREVEVGAKVEVALRPESIECAATPLTLDNAVRGRIVRRLFKGPRTDLDVHVGDGLDVHVALEPHVAAALGEDEVWIGWPADRLSVLRTAA